MQYQRVSKRNPTGKALPGTFPNRNAVAGVKARNGVEKKGSDQRTGAQITGPRPPLASRLVALIDRDGTVTALFRRPDEVRAFLQGGHA